MNLSVNGEVHQLPEGSNLEGLLESLGLLSRKGLAVALNQSVVPRDAWSECSLSESDTVLIIQATQGG